MVFRAFTIMQLGKVFRTPYIYVCDVFRVCTKVNNSYQGKVGCGNTDAALFTGGWGRYQ